MTNIVKVKTKQRPTPIDAEDVVYAPPGSRVAVPVAASWSPADLYRRSPENRRVMLLELMAWAIVKAESCETREEFEAFEQELRHDRELVWGQRPWSGAAKDPEAFARHVNQMAEAFTARPAIYPSRQRQPLAW